MSGDRIGSLETTRARAEADHAEQAWKRHALDCYVCVTARRTGGRGNGPCTRGRPLLTAHLDAQAELKRQRELDKRPITGQVPLW